MLGELPDKLERIAPKEGWKPLTYYEVEVSYEAGNPIHYSILSSGFLDKNREPKPHAEIWSATGGVSIWGLTYYIKPTRLLHTHLEGVFEQTDFH